MGVSSAIESGPGVVDTIPAAAPREVLEAMDIAAQAHERLYVSGRALRFSADRDTGRLNIQLTDHVGNVLRTVSPTGVLHVAGGGGLG